MKVIPAFTALLTLLLIATTASADTFYCGETLIEEGMSRGEVVQHCGQPSSGGEDNWVYDRGPEKFNVEVHFEADGTVGDIQEESQE